MKLGSDFFLIWRIVMAIVKALIEILGDEDDNAAAKSNGF